MTANQMRAEVELKLDVVSSQSTPGLTDAEYSIFLSNAEEIVFERQIAPKALHDSTDILRQNLSTMYVNTTLSVSGDQSDVETNGDIWTLPADLHTILRLSAVMASNTTCLNGKELNVVPKTYDEYNTNISNPFKNPGKGVVWAIQMEPFANATRIQTIHSSDFTSITSLKIAYIKEPAGITVDTVSDQNQVNSLLPSRLHMEIVDEAVKLAKLQLGLLQEYEAQAIQNETNK